MVRMLHLKVRCQRHVSAQFATNPLIKSTLKWPTYTGSKRTMVVKRRTSASVQLSHPAMRYGCLARIASTRSSPSKSALHATSSAIKMKLVIQVCKLSARPCRIKHTRLLFRRKPRLVHAIVDAVIDPSIQLVNGRAMLLRVEIDFGMLRDVVEFGIEHSNDLG